MAVASSSPRGSSHPGLPAVARIRWDRVGRLAMLCVLAAIAYLYLSAGLSLLSTWRESRHDSAQVVALESQNRVLSREHAALLSGGMVQVQARRMGMIRPGEKGYLMSDLPSD